MSKLLTMTTTSSHERQTDSQPGEDKRPKWLAAPLITMRSWLLNCIHGRCVHIRSRNVCGFHSLGFNL